MRFPPNLLASPQLGEKNPGFLTKNFNLMTLNPQLPGDTRAPQGTKVSGRENVLEGHILATSGEGWGCRGDCHHQCHSCVPSSPDTPREHQGHSSLWGSGDLPRCASGASVPHVGVSFRKLFLQLLLPLS